MKRKAAAETKRTKRKPLAARKAAQRKNDRDAIDALVAAGAQALGITLDPSWESGVKFNLQLILGHAARVDEFVLPDDAEPAPIFRA